MCRSNYGSCLVLSGDIDTAEELQRKAVSVLSVSPGPVHPDTARALQRLGLALLQRAETLKHPSVLRRIKLVYKRVKAWFRSSRSSARGPPKRAASSDMGTTTGSSADGAHVPSKPIKVFEYAVEAAEIALTKALEIFEESVGEHHHWTALCMLDLAVAVGYRGRVEEAMVRCPNLDLLRRI